MRTVLATRALASALCLLVSPIHVTCFFHGGQSRQFCKKKGSVYYSSTFSTRDSCTPFTVRHSLPSSQRDHDLGKTAFSTLAAMTVFLLSASPAAAVSSSGFPYLLSGDYSDPLHPGCERHIDVAADGKTFHYSGTAVGSKDDPVLRGCSPEEQKEFGLRKGAFDGMITLDGKGIDAGDGIHNGIWEAGNSFDKSKGVFYDTDGIRWNDGNKWAKNSVSKEDTVADKTGKWIFVAYVVISLLAGAKEMATRLQTWLNRE